VDLRRPGMRYIIGSTDLKRDGIVVDGVSNGLFAIAQGQAQAEIAPNRVSVISEVALALPVSDQHGSVGGMQHSILERETIMLEESRSLRPNQPPHERFRCVDSVFAEFCTDPKAMELEVSWYLGRRLIQKTAQVEDERRPSYISEPTGGCILEHLIPQSSHQPGGDHGHIFTRRVRTSAWRWLWRKAGPFARA
jgi:hypothetical protein